MSGKRQATSDLNHDNWDRDEEPEERGTFKTANEDELKNRVIKKAARRKVTGTDDGASGGTKVFSGFSGFGKPAAATTSTTAFSFLSKIPSASAGTATGSNTSNETNKPPSATVTPSFSFGSTAAKSSASASAKEAKSDTNASEGSSEYYSKLKGLNQAVSEWIKSHVDKNPLCILTPIFKDYEKYLTGLEEEKTNTDKGGTSTASNADNKSSSTTTSTAGIGTFKFSDTTSTAKTSASATPTFSFSSSSSTTTPAATAATKTNGFSFGLKKPEENKETKPTTPATTGFSFGLKSSTETSSSSSSTTKTAASTGFTFGKPAASTEEGSAPKPFSFTPGGTPFSFGNIKPPEAPTTTAENDEEDEEPPKNEFKQVVEDDAVYSKKCKVFVKKDGNFADKGVGTIYLKPIESSEKTQLIVRADTNLGNILVNLILSSAIPAQRMGKNNVMMVCIPTPDVEKPTPMLLRVKTGEEADELLATIEKYKK